MGTRRAEMVWMVESCKVQSKRRLQTAIDAIPALTELGLKSPEFKRWHRNTEVAIGHTFGEASRHLSDFTGIDYVPSIYVGGMPDSIGNRVYLRGLDSAASVLQSMIDEIEEYWEVDRPASAQAGPREGADADLGMVFVVHGRDSGSKEAVARLLARLGLDPVILHEQPNLGQTLIEKFEEHAKVGFAVVLLTPDDVGALQSEEGALHVRARQNVIFEFGYFVGRLGRQRVCALTKGGVELPSDYEGIVYIALDDAGAWRASLVKELRAVGFQVDANLAL